MPGEDEAAQTHAATCQMACCARGRERAPPVHVRHRPRVSAGAFDMADHSALGSGYRDASLVAATARDDSFCKQRLEQIDFFEADLSGCVSRDAGFEGGPLQAGSRAWTAGIGPSLNKANCSRSTATWAANEWVAALASSTSAAFC